MIDVRYPEPRFRMKEEGGRRFLFDAIRRSWLMLTPEEWVRQNFVQYLLQELHYPATLVALEKEIRLHDLRKRFDVLVYDREHQPWMLVECKAPEVALSPAVLDQVLRYNISVPVRYIVITNGAATMAWERRGGGLSEMSVMPHWNEEAE
jgi:hypothetical protein